MKSILIVVLTFAISISISAQSDRKIEVPKNKEVLTNKKDETQEKALGDEGFHVERGTPVTQEGYGLFGDATANHIAIDNDDIQSKNGTGSNYAPLYLNFYGGNTQLGQTLFVNEADHRVGIGTFNPTSILHIESATDGNMLKLRSTSDAISTSEIDFISDDNKNFVLGLNNSSHSSAPGYAYFWNYNEGIRFGAGGAERLRIDPLGRFSTSNLYYNNVTFSVRQTANDPFIFLVTDDDANNLLIVEEDGDATVAGDLTATKFIGDGSMLTNLPTSGGGGCNDYGDGTAGAVTISGNTDWTINPPNTNGNYMFSSLTILSGATLTVASGTKIQVNGAFQNDGTLEVKQCSEGERPSAHPLGTYPGITGTTLTLRLAYPEEQLRFLSTASIVLGGSNGQDGSKSHSSEEGGGGGGLLTLNALTITNGGIIKANGSDAMPLTGGDTGGAGGGGGGFILLQANTITNTGTIEADGGDGVDPFVTNGDAYAGGGGGGGLVRIISQNANAVAGTLKVNGGIGRTTPFGNAGSGGGGNGGAGVGGDGGLGGGFDFDINQAVPADPGLPGKIIRTQVADPCSVLK